MSFDPATYREVADHLCEHAGRPLPEDAALRAAIGRWYYAVLLSARAVTDAGPMPTDRETTHAQVLRALGERDDTVAQLLVADLQTLRTLRNRAEYGDPFTASELTSSAQRARRLCGKNLERVTALARR